MGRLSYFLSFFLMQARNWAALRPLQAFAALENFARCEPPLRDFDRLFFRDFAMPYPSSIEIFMLVFENSCPDCPLYRRELRRRRL